MKANLHKRRPDRTNMTSPLITVTLLIVEPVSPNALRIQDQGELFVVVVNFYKNATEAIFDNSYSLSRIIVPIIDHTKGRYNESYGRK